MRFFTLLGFAAFFVTTLAVGLRLTLLARRTREIPELLIGAAMLALGPLGYGLVVIASLISGLDPKLVLALTAVGVVNLSLGAIALYGFILRVFRPAESWARASCYFCFVLLAVSTVGDVAARFWVRVDGIGFWFWLAFSLRIVPMWWACFESLRYWSALKRRAVLGLADPPVVARFLFWGVGAAAAGMAFTVGLATRALLGRGPIGDPQVSLAVSLLALIAAVAIALAFFPPPLLTVRKAESAANASIGSAGP